MKNIDTKVKAINKIFENIETVQENKYKAIYKKTLNLKFERKKLPEKLDVIRSDRISRYRKNVQMDVCIFQNLQRDPCYAKSPRSTQINPSESK